MGSSPLFMNRIAAADADEAAAVRKAGEDDSAGTGTALLHTIQRGKLQPVPEPQFGSLACSLLSEWSLPLSPIHC